MKDGLMHFDDLLSPEEKVRIRASIAALENLGFNEVKTISLLIRGHWLTIDLGAELGRRANPPVNPVLAAHGLDTPAKVRAAAAMIDKAVRKAGGNEKQSKSKRV